MGAVGKLLTIGGGLWMLIGITNIFAGWTSEDASYDAFLLMFNVAICVVPGGIVAGLGPILRNGVRGEGVDMRERRAGGRAKHWVETGNTTTWP